MSPAPGRVDDALERESGEREEALGCDQRGAVLALLGHDDPRSTLSAHPGSLGAGGRPGEDLAGRGEQVGLARQLAQLGVVEDEAVDGSIACTSDVAGDVDPQVHRVQRDEPRVGQLLAYARCRSGWMFARNSTSLARDCTDSFG